MLKRTGNWLTVAQQALAKVEAADDTENGGHEGQEHGCGGHDGEEAPGDEGPAEGGSKEHDTPAGEVDDAEEEEEEHLHAVFAADGEPAQGEPWNQELDEKSV